MKKTHSAALAALFAGACAIGTSAVLVKLADVGPLASAFWRVALAVPILALWARMADAGSTRGDGRADLRLLLLAGLFFAGDLGFWHWSIILTSVANATLLANCAPILVTLAAWVVFRRKPRMQFLAGLATALGGTALLLRGDFQHAGAALVGDALGIITAMFYAAYQLTVTRARRRMSTARIMFVSGAVTAALLLPVALVSGEQFFPATVAGWLPLVGLALISQVGGQSLIAYAMAHLPATFSSVGLLLQPVVAAALAWAVLSETLGPVGDRRRGACADRYSRCARGAGSGVSMSSPRSRQTGVRPPGEERCLTQMQTEHGSTTRKPARERRSFSSTSSPTT